MRSLLAILVPICIFGLTITESKARNTAAPAKISNTKIAPANSDIPCTGNFVPEMADFDRELQAMMKEWKSPGASVAIVKNGKLVFARGYGFANKEKKIQVQPDSLFRIGSISKLITAVAAVKLIQDGKLSFDTPAFAILKLPIEQDPSRRPEERVARITVRHLLEGTAGWDRDAAGDPMFAPIAQQAAYDYSNSMRPTARAIIRYEISRRLNFEPGTKFCYSNLGYSVLGEIIGKISGKKYDQFVSSEILAPMGITMYPGKTRKDAPGEVRYYPFEGEPEGECIEPNVRGVVALEYGGDFHLEAMTADCGWVGSTIDIANFLSCIFGEQGKDKQILSPKMVKLMVSRPNLQEWQNKDDYFGMGFEVLKGKTPQDMTIKKEGSLPGVTTTAVHKLDGTSFAIAFNTRPKQSVVFQDKLDAFIEKSLSTHKSWLQKQ